MYLPDMFAVTDEPEISALLSGAGLGCLVTRDAEGFFATHLPLLHDAERNVLCGHIARANPHARRSGDGEALVMFQGPQAYVSPSWYPSKKDHGKVVPTWNYEVVHVTGKVVWHDDPAWLAAHLPRLTDKFEAGRPEPWAVSDAPDGFVETLARGIIGVEIDIRAVQAKRKLSQNRTDADRRGVINGLAASPSPADQAVAAAMRALKDG